MTNSNKKQGQLSQQRNKILTINPCNEIPLDKNTVFVPTNPEGHKVTVNQDGNYFINTSKGTVNINAGQEIVLNQDWNVTKTICPYCSSRNATVLNSKEKAWTVRNLQGGYENYTNGDSIFDHVSCPDCGMNSYVNRILD